MKTVIGVDLGGTNIVSAHANLPPVVIGPGDSFIFVEWGTSHAAAHTWDIEMGYIER